MDSWGKKLNFNELSDDDISALIAMPKCITNYNARWKEKPGHRQKNYTLHGEGYDFQVYLRQSNFDKDDFSCGLRVIKPDGQTLTLKRYNGSSHKHHDIKYQCHIHVATEDAINSGRAPENHADATTNYRTLNGALHCLILDCSISGLSGLAPDEPDLFH